MTANQRLPRAQVSTASGTAGAGETAALTEAIQRTWSEFLGVASVGPHDDFFDLGGNSLIVAETLANLEERINVRLPLHALFEAPTPAEMAELIEELRTGPQISRTPGPVEGFTPFHEPWVVPLQREGTSSPVWVVPGGMGGVWTLKRDAQVAALVGTDHPFFGFQRDPPPIAPSQPRWIEAMAAAYVEQMRRIQGHGPYLIYGICAGGSLAWETARQLLMSGDEIAGMLFYEVALPAGAKSIDPPPQARRAGRYVPPPLPVDLTLLMTEVWHARERSAGWHDLASESVTTVVMPGDTPGAHNLYVNREPMIAGHVTEWIIRSSTRDPRR
jgi:acyl carrier protein